MKYVVASLGAVFIATGAMVGLLGVSALIFPAIYKTKTSLVVVYAVVIPLALLAAYGSFRGTLKVYSKNEKNED
jgi:hypothetical protein